MPNKLLITVVVLAGLVGCDAGTPTAGEQAADKTGVIGAIQHGRVTLSVIGDRSIEQVAQARTDANGSFTMRLPRDIQQPMLLEVKPVAGGDSRIICDQDAGCGDFTRGQSMPVPSSFRMMSLITPDELNGAAVSINPYTHVATYVAVGIPGLLNEQTITRAREETGRGYDLSTGFWRHGTETVRTSQELRGVAMTGLSSPKHRLAMRGGRLEVLRESVAGTDRCSECNSVTLASANIGNNGPVNRLF